MNTRATIHTKVSSYTERSKAWRDAIESTNKHIQYGAFIQRKGMNLIDGLEHIKTVAQAEKWQKLFDKALANIDKGMKIEREARRELFDLYQTFRLTKTLQYCILLVNFTNMGKTR